METQALNKNASVEVLVATMHQASFDKYHEMNIQSDAVFANQSDGYSYQSSIINGHRVKMVSTSTRGVGKNRNIALMHSEGDIIVLADDDMHFTEGYEEIVINAFKRIKNADVIIFNIDTEGFDHGRRANKKIKRVHYCNAFNYGAARIAIKSKVLKREGIFFNENFGGGTIYSAGEDSLFIHDMLRNRMKVYVVPETIASVDQSTSTWFSGYHEKFFHDKGALMKAMFPYAYWLMDLIYFPFRFHRISHQKIKDIQRWMFRGSHDYSMMQNDYE